MCRGRRTSFSKNTSPLPEAARAKIVAIRHNDAFAAVRAAVAEIGLLAEAQAAAAADGCFAPEGAEAGSPSWERHRALIAAAAAEDEEEELRRREAAEAYALLSSGGEDGPEVPIRTRRTADKKTLKDARKKKDKKQQRAAKRAAIGSAPKAEL